MPRKPAAIRERIQVYLDWRDRALLDALAKREKVPRSEILRIALRHLGAGSAERATSGLAALTGSLARTSAPKNLAERHDEYGSAPAKRKRALR